MLTYAYADVELPAPPAQVLAVHVTLSQIQ